MKQDKVSLLLRRYLAAQEAGKEIYFDADEVDEILERLETTNDYDHYEGILSLGLRLHPGNTELRIRQCRLYIYNEEYEKALAQAESIVEADNYDLELILLECYCALGQYHNVVSYIESQLQEKPDSVEEIFEDLAPIISDMDMPEEMSDFIHRGLLLFPDNIILKDELCLHLESIGDIIGAIKICNELIDKNPYSVDYWFMLGRLYSMSADYEKAIEAFDFALTCDDSDIELKILKAYCLYMNENYEKAIDVYTEVIAEDEEMSDRIMPLLAECYIKLNRFEEAYQILNEYLINKEPEKDDASTFLNFIRCCMETEREDQATVMLSKAIELYPNNIRLLSILAIKYTEEGKELEAKEVTEKLFKQVDEAEDSNIDNAESLFQTAHYLNLKNEVREALKYYLKILNIDPQMPLINMYIAMAYLSLGDIDKFRVYYKKTSHDELADFINQSDLDIEDLQHNLENKHIQAEDLTKEFLKNKRYRN